MIKHLLDSRLMRLQTDRLEISRLEWEQLKEYGLIRFPLKELIPHAITSSGLVPLRLVDRKENHSDL